MSGLSCLGLLKKLQRDIGLDIQGTSSVCCLPHTRLVVVYSAGKRSQLFSAPQWISGVTRHGEYGCARWPRRICAAWSFPWSRSSSADLEGRPVSSPNDCCYLFTAFLDVCLSAVAAIVKISWVSSVQIPILLVAGQHVHYLEQLVALCLLERVYSVVA